MGDMINLFDSLPSEVAEHWVDNVALGPLEIDIKCQ